MVFSGRCFLSLPTNYLLAEVIEVGFVIINIKISQPCHINKAIFSLRKGDKGYWVSFMDGLQRVMLFTTSSELHERVLQGNKTERPYLELTLSLLAVGISLVDDDRGLEVAYIGMPQ